MEENKYIRFDWAMKRLLRQKANFGILEGLLTTLIGMPIKIQRMLESESNQEDKDDKYNRVDMLAENDKGELFLIEVQNNTEYAYFQRMLFGTSKLLTEYINKGQGYENIKKVYSVNIVYFSLGKGTDIVYHGKTEFRGIHNGDLLELSPFQKQKFKVSAVSDLYPEYFIMKVNDFNSVAKSSIEEWAYYLNTGDVPKNATAPGMKEVKAQLKLDRMSKSEREAYYKHLDNIVILRDNIYTERAEGRLEGRAEGRVEGLEQGRAEGLEQGRAEGLEQGRVEGLEQGRAEGLEQGRAEGKKEAMIGNARKMLQLGLPIETIIKITGLSASDILGA